MPTTMKNLPQGTPPMSIMANDTPISRRVLVRPCGSSRAPHTSTATALWIMADVRTPPPLSWLRAMVRAMKSTTASLSSSDGCRAIPRMVVERRAPLMMSPLKNTYTPTVRAKMPNSGVSGISHLYFILEIPTVSSTPTSSRRPWRSRGA